MVEIEEKFLKKVLDLFNDCVFISSETIHHPQFKKMISISYMYVFNRDQFDRDSKLFTKEFYKINNILKNQDFYHYLNNSVFKDVEWFDDNPIVVLQVPEFFTQDEFFSAPYRIKSHVDHQLKKLECLNYSEDYLLQKKQELIERGAMV